MKKCLIFLEKQYEADCAGLLGAAEELYGDSYESTAVYIDADPSAAEGIADELIRLPGESSHALGIRTLALILQRLHEEKQFNCILIAATHFGRMLAPYLAGLLDCGLVADVTEVRMTEDGVELVRPAFGGRLMAVIRNTKDGPVMMSVRPGVFIVPEADKETRRTVFDCETPERGIVLLERKEKPQHTDIRKCDVLVSGGGGAMDHFDLLEELAVRLGGAVSASRKAVDSGRADRVIQVGQSGRFVHPKLYIAEGIYGALQHVAGIKSADHIIAVNSDPLAPICSLADIVVEADAVSFTEKLIRRIDREEE